MKGPAALLALLLLAGCLTGGPFYAPSDARPAIAPGIYRLTVPDAPGDPQILRVSMLPDGRTRLVPPDRPDEPLDAGFVPLDRGGRFFLGWGNPRRESADSADLYALVERERRGAWRISILFCAGLDDLARSVGARVTGGEPVPLCTFSDRASLERFMRSAIPRRARLRQRSARLAPVP